MTRALRSRRPRKTSSRGTPRRTPTRAGRRTRTNGAYKAPCLTPPDLLTLVLPSPVSRDAFVPLYTRAARRIRDIARKSAHDPLTSISSQLAKRSGHPSYSAETRTSTSFSSRGSRTLQARSRARNECVPPVSTPARMTTGIDSNPSTERQSRESAEIGRAHV